jgi:hypothetical protein
LNWEELKTNAVVAEGTLSIHGSHVTVLIGPGSTHLFVNETHACYLDWVGKELPYVLHMSTPLGRLIMASKYVPDCCIQVGKEVLKVNLIVMPIEDYDLILGID